MIISKPLTLSRLQEMYQAIDKDKYISTLINLSESALHTVASNIRAQEKIGLMSMRECSDKLNCVTAVLLSQYIKEREAKNVFR